MSAHSGNQTLTSRQQQLTYILEQLNDDELRTFVLDTALRSEEFCDILHVRYADLLSDGTSSEKKYRDMLERTIRRHRNTDGFISYENAEKLHHVVNQLLITAAKATTPTYDSIDLCMAVFQTMPTLIDKNDDTDGHSYTLMREAGVTLWECCSDISEERQQETFDRVLNEYANPVYVDLDLDKFLLSLLKEWAKHKKDRQTAILKTQEALLKHKGNDKWRTNYLLEQTNELIAFWKN